MKNTARKTTTAITITPVTRYIHAGFGLETISIIYAIPTTIIAELRLFVTTKITPAGTNASANAASKNGKVTFRALAGLDGTYFNPKTIKVYLFGPFNSITEELLNSIYENASNILTKDEIN